jgi:hypothetical protein
VVVRRQDDERSRSVLTEPWGAVEVTVDEPGVVAAIAAGVTGARSEIVAFLDDDAVRRADRLERLLRHFRDPRVGGVGGRDVWRNEEPRGQPTEDVGRITPWGKRIGNHYLGTGRAREVMVLQARRWSSDAKRSPCLGHFVGAERKRTSRWPVGPEGPAREDRDPGAIVQSRRGDALGRAGALLAPGRVRPSDRRPRGPRPCSRRRGRPTGESGMSAVALVRRSSDKRRR